MSSVDNVLQCVTSLMRKDVKAWDKIFYSPDRKFLEIGNILQIVYFLN